ncbi:MULTISPECIES: nitroreductase family protein [Gordonia]|uniref:Putative oxidoreductase n=1 Tax=Gordonia sputi NBRC 100414 TaxID=1089453 RepID=H5U3E2_9ACTN|nr:MULTISPECIES: nitroreductase family protein [Gordonia]NKY92895.1 nitroreductase family protein [Gordonia sputi]OBA36864.1 nitroreductase [Gordonia sp. 852002-51296_SCH5728562-b]GAB40250.1 putative oxidoreductase [Gordonia sputi NBRC 100414]
MTDLLPLNPDELLTTTRSVRKRLDLERPVPIEVVREALEVAIQAPTGSNAQGWHWIVITDADLKRQVADYYARSFADYSAQRTVSTDTARRVAASAQYLADVMGEVPVLIVGAIKTGADLPTGNQAGVWGSLLPGAWNLMLALRARGLGSAWTTLHLVYEQEVADLLGIPDGVHQGVLLPVAYTQGTDFAPAQRKPLDDVLHINGW